MKISIDFSLLPSYQLFCLSFKIIKMFERAGFAMNYFSNMFKSQYRGLMRYSGQYNLLIFTFGIIYFDHYLESRIRRDLQRVLAMHRTLEKI